MRSAVLVGEVGAVVWDTLAHPSQMAPVGELVGDLPVTVVYSHADWDHAWGTCGIDVRGDRPSNGVRHANPRVPRAPRGPQAVVAHRSAAARFASDVLEELAARRRADRDVWDAVRLVAPTVTFAAEYTLDLGGVTLALHALPGHTPDCIVGFVPEWGVLLAGDTVETPLPVVNDGGAVRRWVEALERWRSDPRVTQVIPAHGRLGNRDVIAETVTYLRGLLAGDARDPGVVPTFYRETHARNARAIMEARSGDGA